MSSWAGKEATFLLMNRIVAASVNSSAHHITLHNTLGLRALSHYSIFGRLFQARDHLRRCYEPLAPSICESNTSTRHPHPGKQCRKARSVQLRVSRKSSRIQGTKAPVSELVRQIGLYISGSIPFFFSS
jgi:hypothetical protein